ncbi:MAG: hypothetical protein AB7F50_11225 [Fimbriimonadaceae bacterium]
MVLLLPLALALHAPAGPIVESDSYDSYRDVPVVRWLGADPEELVSKARAALLHLKPRLNRVVRYGDRAFETNDMESRLSSSVPSVEFDSRSPGVVVATLYFELGSRVEFKLPDPLPTMVALGSSYSDGLRPIAPGEDAPWAEQVAILAYEKLVDPCPGLYASHTSVRESLLLQRSPTDAGVANVSLSMPPEGCSHPYRRPVATMEISVETGEVLWISRTPLPPVRPGDVPTIDMHEAEARVLAAWQRHLAWPNIRIQVEPPGYWFIADNRLDAAHERTHGQQRCFEEKKWILMYVGKIWDPSSGQNGDPLKLCLFQVDAVEGNVINFVDATRRLQALLGTMLSSDSPGGIAPQGPDPPFEPSSVKALAAPGRPPFTLEAGLGPSLAASSAERPDGVSCGVHVSGALREAVAEPAAGRLWVRTDGAGWIPYALPSGAAGWLSRPVEGLRSFGK